MTRVEQWAMVRYGAECAVFYASMGLLAFEREPALARRVARALPVAGFLLGAIAVFFEARVLVFYMLELGRSGEAGSPGAALGACALGMAAGGAAVWALAPRLARFAPERYFSGAGLLVAVGTLMFALGGVPEVEAVSVMAALHRGMLSLTGAGVEAVRSALMLDGHAFIRTPMAGLFEYLGGDRMSTTLVVIVVTVPPVFVLLDLFSRPDPDVAGLDVPAHRRLRVAFFRREMTERAAPMLLSFLLLLVLLHAVNASMNPLSEPAPLPVREAEGSAGVLTIPMSDAMGDFSDGKMRKYVYYHGSDQIIFIAMMKADGTVGVALDECEICRPADWNTAARGYAQRADTLVCKYCMTPVPVAALNQPGGCNPVPVSFMVSGGNVVVDIAELVRVYEALESMEKQGTHY
jgi:hypothetical protein